MPLWTWVTPALAAVLLLTAHIAGAGSLLAALCGIGLIGSVLAAVHHAEVVAHRIGEPFGTLVLALAVTAIETSLIVSMMLAGGEDSAVLPRDTVYAAVMIICNGVVGLCILIGGMAHREQSFRIEGAEAGLTALIVMVALILIFPVFTTNSAGPGTYSAVQMGFVAFVSAALWLVFVFVQTVRHRDYFVPQENPANPNAHAHAPSLREAWLSFGLLLVALVVVVGLAKILSPAIEAGVDVLGAPRAVVGIVIAMLVLLPEAWAAARAARANRLQTSLNLAIGSAVACTGLTIPVVVVAAIMFDLPLTLGLDAKDMVMLAVTFLVSAMTMNTGRTHIMQGAVHLVIFAAFLFLAFAP